ncbi:uncharacterized protein [Lolium perenne]|uniref:uncharacterized protein n=1 Tax=Lolium perenne TaxID=4522 RepID=UPI003A9A333D
MNRRQWMYVDRRLPEFRSGLEEFIRVAQENPQADGFMCCPCVDCHNLKQYPEWQVIHSHLLWKGFMPSYNCWTKHGERGVMMEDDEEEEEDDDMYPNYGDTATGHDEDEDAGGGDQDEEASDEPVDDDLRRAIADAHRDAETENEKRKLKGMLDDHKKKLYPNCEDGNTKLGATLELLQWKAEAGICDKPFEKLLKIMKRRFPKNNELPDSTYEAKKVLCPLGLEVLKIHACINDCILYRAEYENLEKCPVCTALRYKIRRDDPGDVEGEPPRKRVPAKVMWYAPIIPRLKRLFRNKEHARLLRWHKEDRKKDEMLRHPADGSQWRTIDREFPDFADDARNLRFGLSTDGMNPFGEQSCSHSTWPVTLCIYNLPPWLCMKRKFIMMPVLIQGPKQPGNDIDVYLQPLFEELLQLWSKPGVHAWDEYKQESFNLRALLFVTINDWPALSNLSGQTNKGYNACTHCLDETEGKWRRPKDVLKLPKELKFHIFCSAGKRSRSQRKREHAQQMQLDVQRSQELEKEKDLLLSDKARLDEEVTALCKNVRDSEANVVVLQNLLESEKEGNQRLLKELEEAKQALSVITKKQQEILEPTAVSAIKTMSKTFENVGSSAAH